MLKVLRLTQLSTKYGLERSLFFHFYFFALSVFLNSRRKNNCEKKREGLTLLPYHLNRQVKRDRQGAKCKRECLAWRLKNSAMAKALFQLLSRKNSLISDWSVLNKRLQLESEITIKLKQEIKDNKPNFLTFKNWTIICCLVISFTSPLTGWFVEESCFSCSVDTWTSSWGSMSAPSAAVVSVSPSEAKEKEVS